MLFTGASGGAALVRTSTLPVVESRVEASGFLSIDPNEFEVVLKS